jgi:uridine kinase
MEQYRIQEINGDVYQVNQGDSIETLVKTVQEKRSSMIVAAKVHNTFRELTYVFEGDSTIEFVDLTTIDGMRIYQRSLLFVFLRASMELHKNIFVNVQHSLSKGLYCEIEHNHNLSKEEFCKIQKRMQEIIDADEPFIKTSMKKEEAMKIFESYHMASKVNLLKYRESDYINIYSCGWLKNYFYGYMLPSTGYIKTFGLLKYDKGVILRHPTNYSMDQLPKFKETPKLASIFSESETWGTILGVADVASLNDCIVAGNSGELIRTAEALQEKKIAEIADMIARSRKRVILIAGPSSSGKTTFANRLKVQLKVNGLNPITLSTDDYFVNREFTPLDEEGKYDFESIDAVDVKQFNKDLSNLLAGEMVDLPTFDFKTGTRKYTGKQLQISQDQLVIIEGIHGLNEQFTKEIFQKDKFKIYISALTQLNIDHHNRIPTTDTRLLRRIVRDFNYRGNDARGTINQWPSVRKGEEKNIFPYQEDADVIFNSALVYELAVLKKYAEPLLEKITDEELEYSEAKRLLKFLSYVKSIDDDDLIMNISILKEFIGGSAFRE